MKTIRKTNNRQETTSMYMTGREIDRQTENKLIIATNNSKPVKQTLTDSSLVFEKY